MSVTRLIAAAAAAVLLSTGVAAAAVTDLSATTDREPVHYVTVTAGQGGAVRVAVPDRADDRPNALTGRSDRPQPTRYVTMRVGQGEFVQVPQR